jgi:hypothetical protein
MAADRSRHATAFNAQADIQRNRFSGVDDTGILGASRTDMSAIFSSEQPTASQIMTAALNLFTTGSGIPDGENFDFYNGIEAGALTRFSRGSDKFSAVSLQADTPNQFGPNLSVPNINSAPTNDSDTAPENSVTINSPTFVQQGDAGFGTFIRRNEANSTPLANANTEFLNRRGASIDDSNQYVSRVSGQEKLGEYINGPDTNDPYEYEE